MHQIVTENFSKIKKRTWTKGNMEEKKKEYERNSNRNASKDKVKELKEYATKKGLK